MKTGFRLAAALSAGVSLLAVDTALAQQSAMLEEITVTARKRAENLQDVPLSITALTAEDFSRRSITSLADVADYTAGLNFESFATGFNALVTIRGLTQADVQNRITNVGVFLDGAYIPRNYVLDLGLTDFERVEVVKGPQSALYGQNAFAGAINYVTQKPDLEEVNALASVTIGDDGRFDYKGNASVPIIPGKLALRAAYGSTEYDGNNENSFPGVSEDFEEVGGYDNESWNIALRARPIDSLTLDALYLRTEKNAEPRASFRVSGNVDDTLFNCGPPIPGLGTPSFWCGELPDDALAYKLPTTARPSGILLPDQPGVETETEMVRLGASWDISEDVTAEYIYSYVDAVASSIFFSLDNPVGGFGTYQKEGGINEFSSHEVRLAWQPDGGPFSAEVGYYGATNEDDFVFALGLSPGFPGLVIEDNTTGPLDLTGFPIPLRVFEAEDDIDSLFGRIEYSFLGDKATLSAEARQQWTDVDFLDVAAGQGPQSDSYSSFTPRFTGEYALSDDTLLFASAAKGVKAGGFNGFQAGPTTLLEAEQSFDEESNWTYEIGAKNTLLDGRWIFNLTAYYVDWTNQQVTAVPSNFDRNNLEAGTVAPTIFLNVGDVTSYGLEIDGSFLVTPEFSVNYAFSFSDPTFDDGTKWGQFVGICDDVFCPADGEVGGKTLPRQSKHQFTLGAQYETVLFDDFDFYARTDLTYLSKQYVDALNLTYAPGRYTVDASTGIAGENWELQGWVKNLFDEEVVGSSLFVIQFRRYSPDLTPGRALGATFTVRY